MAIPSKCIATIYKGKSASLIFFNAASNRSTSGLKECRSRKTMKCDFLLNYFNECLHLSNLLLKRDIVDLTGSLFLSKEMN
jgi:hypothetical protein